MCSNSSGNTDDRRGISRGGGAECLVLVIRGEAVRNSQIKGQLGDRRRRAFAKPNNENFRKWKYGRQTKREDIFLLAVILVVPFSALLPEVPQLLNAFHDLVDLDHELFE